MKFLTGDAASTAIQLTNEFSAAFPASLEGSQSRKAEEIRSRATKKLLDDIVAMQKEKRMGIIKRIVFARSFQKNLAGAGYSGALIRDLTADALAKLTFASRK